MSAGKTVYYQRPYMGRGAVVISEQEAGDGSITRGVAATCPDTAAAISAVAALREKRDADERSEIEKLRASLDKAHDNVARLQNVLFRLEWGINGLQLATCLSCGSRRLDGHADHCQWRRAMEFDFDEPTNLYAWREAALELQRAVWKAMDWGEGSRVYAASERIDKLNGEE